MSEFSIGAALAAFDEMQRDQREAERNEETARSALDDYAALLAIAHPPEECGDPAGCPDHSEMFHHYHEGSRMTTPDPAALATEYLNLKTQAANIDARIKEIVTLLRNLGEGRHDAGDHTITVGKQPHRFNPDQARTILASNPELLAQCEETVVSSSKAKQLLAPEVYQLCSAPVGEPRVSIA